MRRRFVNNTKDFNFLTIEALEDELYVVFLGEDLEYCIDKSNNWILLPGHTQTKAIMSGQTISFRGSLIPKKNTGVGEVGVGKFEINKKCKLSGNCYSILRSSSKLDYAFVSLFEGNPIVNIEKDFLSKTNLGVGCYNSMFENCANLVNAPDLPALNLTEGCYFYMFANCSNLNYIKMLATDISAPYCMGHWVLGVASTGTFVKNPEATWDVVGDSGVPSGWTVKFDGEE